MTSPFEPKQFVANAIGGADTTSAVDPTSPLPPNSDIARIDSSRTGAFQGRQTGDNPRPLLADSSAGPADDARAQEIWATFAPQSSLRFQGWTFVQPRIAGSPNPDGMGWSFNGSTRVTMAFWLKVNALPDGSWVAPVALSRWTGLWPHINSSGTIQFDLYSKTASTAAVGVSTPSTPLSMGVASHWMAVFDGSGTGPGTLTVYRNGIPSLSASTYAEGPNYFDWVQLFSIGNLGPHYYGFQTGDLELADVAVWNGYAGTEQDAIDLTAGTKRPSDIEPASLPIYITGDGGTIGAAVGSTDVGVNNWASGNADFASNEGFTYSFLNAGGSLHDAGQPTGNSVQGTLKFSGPLSYTPPVEAVPYIGGSGQGIGLLLQTKSGHKAHVPRTATRANVIEVGKAPVLTIYRSGGGTETVTLDPAYVYFSNANTPDVSGLFGQDWLYFDLRAQGIDPIGPSDVVRISAARHWIGLTEGYCDALDNVLVPRSDPLPAVPTGRQTLRVGYNLEAPSSLNIPYYGNWARWADNGRPRAAGGSLDYAMDRDPVTGQWIPGTGAAGGYFESTLVNADGIFGVDGTAVRGPSNDGTGNEQYLNPYYDNATFGTAGFKLGWGFRAIPKRGKIHIAWKCYDGHDGDGEGYILLGQYGDNSDHSLVAYSTTGPQAHSWTFDPTTQAGPDGWRYKTYEYVCNDPIGGVGDHGDRLMPQLRLRYSGYATNITVTVEAASDLPEAVYNVDKFNPPTFHPYLTDEVLRDVDTIRLMGWSAAGNAATSGADQYTPYDHYTWGQSYSNAVFDEVWPLEIPITAITPIVEPEATALRAAWPGSQKGGFPMKLTLAGGHQLAHGALASIDWGGCVTLTGVSDQDGVTYNVLMDPTSWTKVARPLSSTELLLWAWFDQPGGGKPYGILSRTYSGGELGGAKILTNRVRTLPLRAVGELATQCGLNVHYSLPTAIALDPVRAAAWADAVAPYFPADRELYLECSNELWNYFGPYSVPLGAIGDDLGLVDGQMPNDVQEYAHYVRVTARAAKSVRQRWAAHGLDPGKVKCLINTGPGVFLSYAIPVIQEMNTSGDPLLRIDELAPNTYCGNFGDEDDLSAFPGYADLGVEQTLDLFELRVRGNYPFANVAFQRAALDASGLADVALSSYEGGTDAVTIGVQIIPRWDNGDVANQLEHARLARTQTGVFRHPRWAGIKRAALARLQEYGLTRQTQFIATGPPHPGYDSSGQFISRNFWTSYISMEPSGTGDGTDGKWDNRASTGRPYGPYAEGDSVSVDAYAIKAWNAMDSATNLSPTLILPTAVPAVAAGQPITFQATASDPDVGQVLNFSLLPGAPDGATIDPASGRFQWIPNQPGSWTITVRVSDNGSPPLSATGSLILRAVQKPKFVPRRRRSSR